MAAILAKRECRVMVTSAAMVLPGPTGPQSPDLKEVKKVYQYVGFEPVDLKPD